MDSSSLLTSLTTYFAVFVVLMFLYTRLARRPWNRVMYYSSWILKALDPWEGSRAPKSFDWIKEAFFPDEYELIIMSGVDTAVYFVFLRTVLGILVLSGLVLLPMLLPVAAYESQTSTETLKGVDKYTIGHVKAKSSRLWAFVIAVYWVSLVSYYLLWKACKNASALRASIYDNEQARHCSQQCARQYAILVRDIPPVVHGEYENRKHQIDTYFRLIYPDTFYQSIVVTDNTKINKIWEALEGFKKKLGRAETKYFESKTNSFPEGTRPTNRIGLFGLIGRKVDTIEYLNKRIIEVEAKLDAEQKVTLEEKQLSAALVFFNCRVAAAAAAQSQHSQTGDKWTTMEAPEPCQIIWSNLSLSYYERKIRQFVVYVMVALTILFYMIPLGFISALTTLANLENFLPCLKPIVEIKAVKTVLEAYLPQLALMIFLAVLPKLLMFLSVLEGIPSTSHATIEEDPHKTVGIFAENLSDNASVFLNYVALKFLVGYGLELSRLIPLIVFHLKRKYICKSEEDVKEAWAPGDLGYETRFPGDMLIATIVLCYSVIAPLIIPFGIAYFGLGWLILRNQALKVYVPAFESNGRMWPHIHTRLVGALLLFQVTMIAYSGVKEFYYTPLLIPLPIISLAFAFTCKNKFYRYFKSPSVDYASSLLCYDHDMEQVVQYFIPLGLKYPGKTGEHKSEDESGAISRSAV